MCLRCGLVRLRRCRVMRFKRTSGLQDAYLAEIRSIVGYTNIRRALAGEPSDTEIGRLAAATIARNRQDFPNRLCCSASTALTHGGTAG